MTYAELKSNPLYTSDSKLCTLANSEYPDEMSHYVAFHQGLLIDFSLTVKVVTLIFISGRGSAISSAKEGKSGSIHNLVKN